MPLLRIMAGPDGLDTGCCEWPLGDPADVTLAGMTLLNVEDNGALLVSDDLRAAQARAVGALAARGMKIETARFDTLRKQFDIWSAMLGKAQDVPFGTMLGEGDPIRPGWELMKLAAGRSDYTIMASLLALVDPVTKLLPGMRDRLVAEGLALRAELVDRIGPRGVMLYPTYTTPAPKHNVAVRDALRLRFPFAYQGIMNVLELPSTQVPLGLNHQRIPLGVQVVGIHGNDHVTIAVALELERIFGGWSPPPAMFASNATAASL